MAGGRQRKRLGCIGEGVRHVKLETRVTMCLEGRRGDVTKEMDILCRARSVILEKGSSKGLEKSFDYLNRKKENLIL